MADEDFSPETHRIAPPRYFDDFRVGERFYIPSRTMTDVLFAAFLDQSSRFLKPVYAGDTLYPMLAITRLEPGRTTGVVAMRVTIHNQDKELVMDGEHRYLLRRKP